MGIRHRLPSPELARRNRQSIFAEKVLNDPPENRQVAVDQSAGLGSQRTGLAHKTSSSLVKEPQQRAGTLTTLDAPPNADEHAALTQQADSSSVENDPSATFRRPSVTAGFRRRLHVEGDRRVLPARGIDSNRHQPFRCLARSTGVSAPASTRVANTTIVDPIVKGCKELFSVPVRSRLERLQCRRPQPASHSYSRRTAKCKLPAARTTHTWPNPAQAALYH